MLCVGFLRILASHFGGTFCPHLFLPLKLLTRDVNSTKAFLSPREYYSQRVVFLLALFALFLSLFLERERERERDHNTLSLSVIPFCDRQRKPSNHRSFFRPTGCFLHQKKRENFLQILNAKILALKTRAQKEQQQQQQQKRTKNRSREREALFVGVCLAFRSVLIRRLFERVKEKEIHSCQKTERRFRRTHLRIREEDQRKRRFEIIHSFVRSETSRDELTTKREQRRRGAKKGDIRERLVRVRSKRESVLFKREINHIFKSLSPLSWSVLKGGVLVVKEVFFAQNLRKRRSGEKRAEKEKKRKRNIIIIEKISRRRQRRDNRAAAKVAVFVSRILFVSRRGVVYK